MKHSTLRQQLHHGQLLFQALCAFGLLGWIGFLGLLLTIGYLPLDGFELVCVGSSVAALTAIMLQAAIHHHTVTRNTAPLEWLTAQLHVLIQTLMQTSGEDSNPSTQQQTTVDHLRIIAEQVSAHNTSHHELRTVMQSFECCCRLLTEQATQVALGAMTTQVAHDIRGPVATLRVLLHTLAPSLTEPQHHEILRVANETVQRLEQMADDLCDVAKARHPQCAVVDVAQLIGSIVHEGKMRCPPLVTITYEGDPNYVASIDALKMQRVLSNLLDNAMHAMPADRSGDICVRLLPQGTSYTIVVQDSGAGISPAHQAKLFKKFFTTKGAKGNGLGLPYCKDVIEAHGGSFTIASTLGLGTTITMVLPNTAEELRTPETKSHLQLVS